MENLRIGKMGEQYAIRFLTSRKYHIQESNYHSRFGELDIIAVDPTDKTWVFVEVKTRKSDYFGLPEESVDRKKFKKMLKTAQIFLSENKKTRPFVWRFDVISLKLNKEDKIVSIKHFKNIHHE